MGLKTDLFIVSGHTFKILVAAEIGLLAKTIIHEEPFPLPQYCGTGDLQQPKQSMSPGVKLQHMMHLHAAHNRHKTYCSCFTVNSTNICHDACAVEVTFSRSLIPQQWRSGNGCSWMVGSATARFLLQRYFYTRAKMGIAHEWWHYNRINDLHLTLRRLMSYIYGAPILDVFRSHTTTQHSR